MPWGGKQSRMSLAVLLVLGESPECGEGGGGADMYILNVTICLELEGVGSSYLGLPTDALLPIIIFTQTLQMPQHLFFG